MAAGVRARIFLVLCILILGRAARSNDAIRLQFHPEIGNKQTLCVTWRLITSFQSPSGPERMEYFKSYTLEFEPVSFTSDRGTTFRIGISRVQDEAARVVNDESESFWQNDSSDSGNQTRVSMGNFVAFHGATFSATFSPQSQLVAMDTEEFHARTAKNRMKHEDDAAFLLIVKAHDAMLKLDRTQLSAAEKARLYRQEKAEAQITIDGLNKQYGSPENRLRAYEKDAPTSRVYGVAELQRWVNHVMAPLPAEPVRPGDSWEAPVRIFLEGPMEMIGTHTLEKITDDTVTIKVEAQRTLDDKPAPCADGFLRAEKLAGTYQATLVVDRHSGWLRSRAVEMNLTGSLALPQHPAAGPDGTVPVTTQAFITVKAID